jgi:hypothetical protein
MHALILTTLFLSPVPVQDGQAALPPAADEPVFAPAEATPAAIEGAQTPAAPSLSPTEALLDRLSREGLAALRAIWTETGVTSSLFSATAETAPLIVLRSSGDLDGSGGDELILTITDGSEVDYQILAMAHDGSSWSSRGAIELWNQRDAAPTHRLASIGGSRWLVVRWSKASGAGFTCVQETWHRSTGSSFTSDLTYPVDGQVSGHGLAFDRTFQGTYTGVAAADGNAAVTVDLFARYTNGSRFAIEGLDELFTRQETARWVFDGAASRFDLDEAASGMTEAEIDGLFADDEQGFLLHNFDALRELASNGSDLQREWLRKFLATRDECSEKTILEAILQPATATGDAVATGGGSTRP